MNMSHTIDWTQVVSNLFLVGVNGILIRWVYKVLSDRYSSLDKQFTDYRIDTGKRISKLEKDLVESNMDATSWFKRFYKLTSIIEMGHCRDRSCKVYFEYNKLQQEEGEVIKRKNIKNINEDE